ncbi:hypothetical protein [Methylobacterium sp. P1-11]|uniref:hypothetical protein n=1 Tax=Methylobacterium sp. P1-11 TaxID=2024616 RepID=UPI0011EF386F|nr:hypothetical protein [Methylobacterium sp. P1-11]
MALNWLNRRDAVRKAKAEAEAGLPWASLAEISPLNGDRRHIRVLFHNATDDEFRIASMRVVRPRGARALLIQATQPEGALLPVVANRSIAVDWRVYPVASSRQLRDVSGTGEFWLEPRHSWLRPLGRRVQAVEVELRGAARPPSRSAITIRATLKTRP